jgi:hypothetical protein
MSTIAPARGGGNGLSRLISRGPCGLGSLQFHFWDSWPTNMRTGALDLPAPCL